MNQVIPTPEVKQEPVLVQEKVSTTVPTQNNENVVAQTQQVPEPETEKEINWKKFKEARAKEREQAEAMAKKAAEKEAEAAALKAAMEAMLNKPQQPQYSNNGYEQEEESEDQKIEKKVNALLAKREAEAERKKREQEQAELPQTLSRHHPDFNQVCSTENLDYLEYHYPEVAQAFRHMPDGYDKWASVYKAVKRFVPNIDTRKDQAKVDRNLVKPQSMSAPGTSQSVTTPNRLDDSRRAANWERMQRTMKGLT